MRPPKLRRFTIACLTAALALISVIVPATVAHADATCASGGVQWTAKAIWGARYTQGSVSKIDLQVSWTANVAKSATVAEAVTTNSDGTTSTVTMQTQPPITYNNGTTWKTLNATDPAGLTPSVQLRLGVDTYGCTFTFTPPGTVLFVDDFNGAVGQPFDPAKWQDWSTCTYNSSAAYGNIKYGDTETLDGAGHLRIPATPTTGASLSTANKFSFTYGEISAWIKGPAADGYWPAFWTLNNDPHGVNHPIVGEVDVMEQYTTWDTLFHRAVHNWSGSTSWGGPDDNSYGNVDLTATFHKYTARVEPGKVSFYFDDRLTGSLSKAAGAGKPWAFGPDLMEPNWLILTLAIGGAGGRQNPATVPAVMLVDRVEVRAL